MKRAATVLVAPSTALNINAPVREVSAMSVNRQYGESTPEIKTGFVEYEKFDWGPVSRKARACGVYVFSMDDTPFCKVGSTGSPKCRHDAIKTSIPFTVSFPFFVTGGGGMSHVEVELEAQKALSDKVKNGEWFECSEAEAIEAVRSAVAKVKAQYA